MLIVRNAEAMYRFSLIWGVTYSWFHKHFFVKKCNYIMNIIYIGIVEYHANILLFV